MRPLFPLFPLVALAAGSLSAQQPAPAPAAVPPAPPGIFGATEAPPSFSNQGSDAMNSAMADNAGVPPAAAGLAGRGDPNTAENYDFTDQPLINVLRLLAARARMNFIAPALKTDEKITLNLVGLTPRDAFTRIAEARGFRVVDSGRAVTLERSDVTSPQAFITRTYTPRVVRVAHIAQALSNALGIELAKPGNTSPAYPDPQQAGGVASIVDAQARPRFTSALPMDEKLSKGPSGETLHFIRRTNQVIIRATLSQHEAVQALLATLDRDLPQIGLTCYVIEITESRDNTLGVDWTNTLGPNGLRLGLATNATGTDTTTPIIKLARALFYQGSILTASNAEIAVRALLGNRNARALSSPNLIAQPGIPQDIAVVDKETIALVNTVSSGNLSSTNTSLQTFVTGLTLSVIADLLPDGKIGLNITPSISSRTGATATAIGNIPTSRERRTTADVIVPDGCAIVLGGILSASDERGVSEVPGLGRIPVIGALFKNNTRSSARTNLVIVVTARTLRQPSRQRLGPREEGAIFDATAGLPDEPAYRYDNLPAVVPGGPTTTTTTTVIDGKAVVLPRNGTRRAVRP